MWFTSPQAEFPIRAGPVPWDEQRIAGGCRHHAAMGAWQAHTARQQVNEVVNGMMKSNGGG
jgi:hypothetical protein